jgi:hypothetical protein
MSASSISKAFVSGSRDFSSRKILHHQLVLGRNIFSMASSKAIAESAHPRLMKIGCSVCCPKQLHKKITDS